MLIEFSFCFSFLFFFFLFCSLLYFCDFASLTCVLCWTVLHITFVHTVFFLLLFHHHPLWFYCECSVHINTHPPYIHSVGSHIYVHTDTYNIAEHLNIAHISIPVYIRYIIKCNSSWEFSSCIIHFILWSTKFTLTRAINQRLNVLSFQEPFLLNVLEYNFREPPPHLLALSPRILATLGYSKQAIFTGNVECSRSSECFFCSSLTLRSER